MKKLLSLLLVSLALVTSCGEVSYKADVALAELTVAADAKLDDTDTFTSLDADYVKYMMEIDEAAFTESAVRQQASGRSADEYGIFKAADEESAKALGTLLEGYLKKRIDTWNPAYDADQYPKIENAEVKVFGQYAVYCILSEADRGEVFAEIESALTK